MFVPQLMSNAWSLISIAVLAFLSFPGVVFCGEGFPGEPDYEQRNGSGKMVQAVFFGAGTALILTSVIFEDMENEYTRYYDENGSGVSINVKTETGNDTETLFLAGVVFLSAALLIEIFPSGEEAKNPTSEVSRSSRSEKLTLGATMLEGGAAGLGIVGGF